MKMYGLCLNFETGIHVQQLLSALESTWQPGRNVPVGPTVGETLGCGAEQVAVQH